MNRVFSISIPRGLRPGRKAPQRRALESSALRSEEFLWHGMRGERVDEKTRPPPVGAGAGVPNCTHRTETTPSTPLFLRGRRGKCAADESDISAVESIARQMHCSFMAEAQRETELIGHPESIFPKVSRSPTPPAEHDTRGGRRGARRNFRGGRLIWLPAVQVLRLIWQVFQAPYYHWREETLVPTLCRTSAEEVRYRHAVCTKPAAPRARHAKVLSLRGRDRRPPQGHCVTRQRGVLVLTEQTAVARHQVGANV